MSFPSDMSLKKNSWQTRGKMHLQREDGTIICGVDPGFVNNYTKDVKLVNCSRCLQSKAKALARKGKK